MVNVNRHGSGKRETINKQPVANGPTSRRLMSIVIIGPKR